MGCDSCDNGVLSVGLGDSLDIDFVVSEKVQAKSDAICQDETGGGAIDLTGLSVTGRNRKA